MDGFPNSFQYGFGCVSTGIPLRRDTVPRGASTHAGNHFKVSIECPFHPSGDRGIHGCTGPLSYRATGQ